MVKSEGVHKYFGRLEVLKGIDLQVMPGEVMCVIGPSGSGKSTFLRCINHLEKLTAGKLWVDGELVGYRQKGDKLYELRDSEVAAKRREIGMVFQRFNLFPHMTACENVMEAPIQVRGDGKALARKRALDLLERVGPGGQGEGLPAAAVRRPAATRRDRPGARDGPEADAVRRADLRARPRARRRGAGGHAQARRRRHDHDRGHPRDGLRPRGRRPLVFMDDGVVVEQGHPRDVIANPQHERTKSFLGKVLM